MWFKKKQADEVDLTNDSYVRWLQAQRPPFEWFLAQPEMIQETLAQLGIEHAQDLCVAFALALKNPEAVDAGLNGATNPAVEEELAKNVALALVQKAMTNRGNSSPQPSPAPEDSAMTMAGMMDRREGAEKARKREGAKGYTFLGHPPDVLREAAPEATEDEGGDAP